MKNQRMLDRTRARVLAALALPLVAVAFCPSAAANQASVGLSAKLAFPGGAEIACGPEVPVDLVLRNVDRHPLDVLALDLPSEAVYPQRPALPNDPQPGEDDPALRPAPPADGPFFRPTRLGGDAPQMLPLPGLPADGEVRLPLRLTVPQGDGPQREVVRVVWAYDAAASKADVDQEVEAVLYYVADGGCVSLTDVEAWHAATDPVVVRRVFLDGLSLDVADIAGPVLPSALADESDAQTIFEVTDGLTPLYNDDGTRTGATTLDLRFCVRARYLDNFQSCPTDTTGMDWWMPYCDQTTRVPVLGLVVHLYDHDSVTSDDYIGSYALHYDDLDDYSCISFSWNQNLRDELYPDVYIKTNFDVVDTEYGANEWAHLCQSDQEAKDECEDKYGYTWSAHYESNLSGTAYKSLSFGDEVNIWNRRAMSMAAIQHFLRSFRGNRMTGDLNAWWNGDQCTDSSGNPWPCSYDDNWFTVTDDLYRRWTVGPHEAGHCYQKQLFEQGSLTGQSCPDPHYLDGASNDACATREGFAEFVSTVTWYPLGSGGSSGDPVCDGEQVEDGAKEYTSCSQNAMTEIQVARTFWDLYDSQADGLDTASVDRTRFDIARTWDAFSNGTGNHNDKEGGSNGCNLWDFHYNAAWSADMQSDTEAAMEQNDTDCQSTL